MEKLTREQEKYLWELAHNDCNHYLCKRRLAGYSKKALCPTCRKRLKGLKNDYI